MDRRGFLRGSALFAAALRIAGAVPAIAQEQQAGPVEQDDSKKDEGAKKDTAPEQKGKPLIDKEGREYRICDMCGGNMYLQENTWSCEQCGFSYEA